MADLTKPRKATEGRVRARSHPQITAPKAKTWITRGGNFAGRCLGGGSGRGARTREADPEEHMVILPPDGAERVTIDGGRQDDRGKAGLAHDRAAGRKHDHGEDRTGSFAQIYSKASSDIMALASNAATYADGAPELAPPICGRSRMTASSCATIRSRNTPRRTATASSRACSARPTCWSTSSCITRRGARPRA